MVKETETEANQKIAEYKKLKESGFTYEELVGTTKSNATYDELNKIITLSPGATKEILQKDNPDKEYIPWVKWKIIESEEDKKIFIQSKAAINSIVPTMSSIGGSVEEEMITLKWLITYVEWTLLKQFNIRSLNPVSLQWVSFLKIKDLPENMGFLDLRIDLAGRSQDIMDLIRFVNKSWDPKSLEAARKVWWPTPRVLENPLFTITQFSLQDLPTNLDPGDENTGKLSMRLYLRGWAPKDIRYFQTQIIERIDNLIRKVEEEQKKCDTDKNLCQNKDRLDEFMKKLKIVRKGMNDAVANRGGLGQIYVLSQFFTTLKSLEDEVGIFISKK